MSRYAPAYVEVRCDCVDAETGKPDGDCPLCDRDGYVRLTRHDFSGEDRS